MTRIRIDLAAPIACTATAEEIPTRIGQLERMRAELGSIERTTEGLLLCFTPESDLAAHLERFAVEEKGCCRFWGFEVRDGDELTLRWDGPAAAQPVLDELLHWFEGDEPLTSLAGLL